MKLIGMMIIATKIAVEHPFSLCILASRDTLIADRRLDRDHPTFRAQGDTLTLIILLLVMFCDHVCSFVHYKFMITYYSIPKALSQWKKYETAAVDRVD